MALDGGVKGFRVWGFRAWGLIPNTAVKGRKPGDATGCCGYGCYLVVLCRSGGPHSPVRVRVLACACACDCMCACAQSKVPKDQHLLAI